jgi:hypothetical protein
MVSATDLYGRILGAVSGPDQWEWLMAPGKATNIKPGRFRTQRKERKRRISERRTARWDGKRKKMKRRRVRGNDEFL